jgi:hypothetical protein
LTVSSSSSQTASSTSSSSTQSSTTSSMHILEFLYFPRPECFILVHFSTYKILYPPMNDSLLLAHPTSLIK